MQVRIRNLIDVGGQSEVIEETHEADYRERAGKCYLTYRDTNGEKVAIKFDSRELLMIRFSEGLQRLHFRPSVQTEVDYEGLGGVQICTESLQIGPGSVALHYQLIQNSTLLGNYRFTLTYEN